MIGAKEINTSFFRAFAFSFFFFFFWKGGGRIGICSMKDGKIFREMDTNTKVSVTRHSEDMCWGVFWIFWEKRI